MDSINHQPISTTPFLKIAGQSLVSMWLSKTPDGDYLTDCMSKDEIDAIMNRSQSVKSNKSSPWKSDYGEMAKKTVVKRAYKYWPKTDRLDKAFTTSTQMVVKVWPPSCTKAR